MGFSINAHDYDPQAEDMAYDDAKQLELDDLVERARNRAMSVARGVYGDPAWGAWPKEAQQYVRDLTNKYLHEQPEARRDCAVEGCHFLAGKWGKWETLCFRHYELLLDVLPIPGCTCKPGPEFCPACKAILDAPVGGVK